MKLKALLLSAAFIFSTTTASAFYGTELDAPAIEKPSDSFAQIGQCYIYTPRIDSFVAAEVTQVTSQEIVFKNRFVVWPTAKTPDGLTNDTKFMKLRQADLQKTVADYIASKNRQQKDTGVNDKSLPNIVSYSRGAITMIPLDRCGK